MPNIHNVATILVQIIEILTSPDQCDPVGLMLTRTVGTNTTYNPFSIVDLYCEPKVMGIVEVAVTTPATPGMFVISTSTIAVSRVMDGCPVNDVALLSLLASMSG